MADIAGCPCHAPSVFGHLNPACPVAVPVRHEADEPAPCPGRECWAQHQVPPEEVAKLLAEAAVSP